MQFQKKLVTIVQQNSCSVNLQAFCCKIATLTISHVQGVPKNICSDKTYKIYMKVPAVASQEDSYCGRLLVNVTKFFRAPFLLDNLEQFLLCTVERLWSAASFDWTRPAASLKQDSTTSVFLLVMKIVMKIFLLVMKTVSYVENVCFQFLLGTKQCEPVGVLGLPF